ncbi:citrate synthase [Bittarella massiliensis (ex Durand et al. 2017)]|uniref:citrate synthase n=1 Tax=Bittarella massiliensis (ex Durand et al. 2017) TaxID=1720313 RepID=UPI001AA1A548|nr:citrate synthase [Bittarella massiliensis (ex Durand et al. 2017)]
MGYNVSGSKQKAINILCDEFRKYNFIDPEDCEKLGVKRGLRNADNTGVLAGLTLICDVVGYEMIDGVKTATPGKLLYRGIDLDEFVAGVIESGRYGFEELSWLLLFGKLPTQQQLDFFNDVLADFRALPPGFAEDMIMKAPSPDVMNKLARSILAMYSYDDEAEDLSIGNVMRQCIEIIAGTPTIITNAYQVKRRNYDHKSMYFHLPKREHSTAQTILRTVRPDKRFTEEEAHLLDLCLILHAEHGGGNNSAFACRVLSSSLTDTYSALASAVGSLKGPRHGGANLKVTQMLEGMKEAIPHPASEQDVKDYLRRLLRREAGDRSGLIYGIGHAVYTVSDPRAQILKRYAEHLAVEKGFGEDLHLLQMVEKLAPQVFVEEKGVDKNLCANVDLYSGLVYRTLGIPEELFTPLFAVARMPGWCAHRMEELMFGGRIIRPAYKNLTAKQSYVPINQR